MSRDALPSPDDVHENGVDVGGDFQLVTIVGAGPAGLMLGSTLARYGIKAAVIDNRDDKTSTGRADGLQPKTIETFQQLRLSDALLQRGVKIYDICFWHSSATESLRRQRREIHYPADLDVENPFILLVHQGMVEDVFLKDLRERNIEVTRGLTFQKYECTDELLRVTYTENKTGTCRSFDTRYLIGCDGARGNVRPSIPGAEMIGEISNSKWGVIDGVIETNFPDLWSKVVIHSETAGTVLCIPRERNMTRLYIELDRSIEGSERATQELVMRKAQLVMAPYSVTWTSVEWFSVYKVGQRVSSTFINETSRVFIAGDAAHTHSPKAAQGMNTSMHDTFNLSWKLNLDIRGLSKPALLSTYQDERRKIAQDLINFDFEHAAAFTNGDAKALADNFAMNVGFISGFGVKYATNAVNVPERHPRGKLRAGELVPPAKVTRYIDANPVNIELDVPLLGQFRVYFFATDILASSSFLSSVCAHISSAASVQGRATIRAAKSYVQMPIRPVEADQFVQPMRYIPESQLFTFAAVTGMEKSKFDVSDLPAVLQKSRWTVYLDDIKDRKTGESCTQKWVGRVAKDEVVIVNVRPDGYVGTVGRFVNSDGVEACEWLDSYYGGFLLA
ncbi:hypothetical protein LTS18_003306 [Coniosporium uncinatum]|uniref:Uncharacterized protein n=1 Tax=Coniosporium uncinatum TaxID=93489 RepID=A0ACC3DYG2_9PEZI|nr:hypothetical protein LTS18_003306 [Coniosporium uncinatum]